MREEIIIDQLIDSSVNEESLDGVPEWCEVPLCGIADLLDGR